MSIILRCPHCEKHYETADNVVKLSELQCALCGQTAAVSDFSAMMFCPNCRGKLAVSLDMLNIQTLQCPRCDMEFSPSIHISLDDEDDAEITLFDKEESRKALFSEGDFFDKYKIVSLLGRGGMGEVYLAEHLFFHRTVALKIMLSEMAKNSVFAKRFIREAKLANRIESANLINVFDVGIDSKTEMLFIAMEYVDGKNLSELIKLHGVFDEQTSLGIAYNVANALMIMEQEKVVHRDIKPSNIMIDSAGNIKLADLGIAKSNNHADGDLTLTQESAVFGTPNYASPEQCRSSHNVDTRSDIYSLGATMFHMVTGSAPYNGSTTMEVMLKVLGNELPDFYKLNGKSAGFIALVCDMLQKDPDKRPQTVEDLQDRIEKLFSGESALKYKARVIGKRILPMLKNIGLKLLKVPLWLFSKKSDSVIRHFLNFILFCIFLYLGGIFVNRHRDYLSDLWGRFTENGSRYSSDEDAENKIQKSQAVRKQKSNKNIVKKSSSQKNLNKANANANEQPEKAVNSSNPVQTAENSSAPPVKQPENHVGFEEKQAETDNGMFRGKDASADKNKSYPSNISGRLARCNSVIADLKKQIEQRPNDRWLAERLDYMEKTVKVNLEKQRENRRMALELDIKGGYDLNAEEEIKSVFREMALFNNRNDTQRNTIRDMNRLLRVMKSKNFNPNLILTDHNNNDISLLSSVIRLKKAGAQPVKAIAEKMIDILLEKYVYITSEKIADRKILLYGVDDMSYLWPYQKLDNDSSSLISALIDCGVDIKASSDPENMYPENNIHNVIRYCNFSTVRKLFLAGADVNAANKEGQTPLFFAVKYGNEKLAEFLISIGANIEHRDKFGKKVLNYNYRKDLTVAAEKKDFKKLTELLDKYPDIRNAVLDDRRTLLDYAIDNYNVALVKKILEKPFDINVRKSLPNLLLNAETVSIGDKVYPRGHNEYDYFCRRKLQILKMLLPAIPDADKDKYCDILVRPFIAAYAYECDNYDLDVMYEICKHTKTEKLAAAILDKIYFDYKVPSGNYSARYKIISKLLENDKFDLSSKVYKNSFESAVRNLSIPEKELALLLKNNADKDLTNMKIQMLYESGSPEDVKKRIKMLLDKGVKFDNRELKTLNL